MRNWTWPTKNQAFDNLQELKTDIIDYPHRQPFIEGRVVFYVEVRHQPLPPKPESPFFPHSFIYIHGDFHHPHQSLGYLKKTKVVGQGTGIQKRIDMLVG